MEDQYGKLDPKGELVGRITMDVVNQVRGPLRHHIDEFVDKTAGKGATTESISLDGLEEYMDGVTREALNTAVRRIIGDFRGQVLKSFSAKGINATVEHEVETQTYEVEIPYSCPRRPRGFFEWCSSTFFGKTYHSAGSYRETRELKIDLGVDPTKVKNELLQKFDVEVREYVRTAGLVKDSLTVLLHGGEPTLCNPPEVRAFVKNVEERNERHGITVKWTMQSNGYCLTEPWLRLIADCGIDVGISIDGPESIHDTIRKTRNGEGSYRHIMDTVRWIEAETGQRVSYLTVVDHRQAEDVDGFVDWLFEQGRPVKMDPCFDVSGAGSVSCSDYFRFLSELYVKILSKGQRINFSLAPLDKWVSELLFHKGNLECSLSRESGRRILSYSSNGRISLCGRLVDSDVVYVDYVAGHLSESREEMLTRLEMLNGDFRRRRHCDSCPYLNLCHGGCTMLHRNEDTDDWCQAASEFLVFLKGEGLECITCQPS